MIEQFKFLETTIIKSEEKGFTNPSQIHYLGYQGNKRYQCYQQKEEERKQTYSQRAYKAQPDQNAEMNQKQTIKPEIKGKDTHQKGKGGGSKRINSSNQEKKKLKAKTS
ncbi:hypothetical protein [Chryseobacterium indoltheticum]|uniref:hypothetical protein n=1 Tax=Chryseobacterium indoltheticum TaxID=254 RepID=UPI003F495B41